jgi:hypothetical protein
MVGATLEDEDDPNEQGEKIPKWTRTAIFWIWRRVTSTMKKGSKRENDGYI